MILKNVGLAEFVRNSWDDMSMYARSIFLLYFPESYVLGRYIFEVVDKMLHCLQSGCQSTENHLRKK